MTVRRSIRNLAVSVVIFALSASVALGQDATRALEAERLAVDLGDALKVVNTEVQLGSKGAVAHDVRMKYRQIFDAAEIQLILLRNQLSLDSDLETVRFHYEELHRLREKFLSLARSYPNDMPFSLSSIEEARLVLEQLDTQFRNRGESGPPEAAE